MKKQERQLNYVFYSKSSSISYCNYSFAISISYHARRCLCCIAVFVDVFGGNVDASVVPFEGVGDGECFESVRFAEWSKDGITGYDIGEVECAALSIVEGNL